jgi:hypothetical protein
MPDGIVFAMGCFVFALVSLGLIFTYTEMRKMGKNAETLRPKPVFAEVKTRTTDD